MDESEMMTPGEVAEAFNVSAKTVGKWAAAGKLTVCRTLGGHRRFVRAEVEALLAATRVGRSA